MSFENVVIRVCQECKHSDKQEEFRYLRDSIWACPICGSKWTEIKEVIDPDKK